MIRYFPATDTAGTQRIFALVGRAGSYNGQLVQVDGVGVTLHGDPEVIQANVSISPLPPASAAFNDTVREAMEASGATADFTATLQSGYETPADASRAACRVGVVGESCVGGGHVVG